MNGFNGLSMSEEEEENPHFMRNSIFSGTTTLLGSSSIKSCSYFLYLAVLYLLPFQASFTDRLFILIVCFILFCSLLSIRPSLPCKSTFLLSLVVIAIHYALFSQLTSLVHFCLAPTFHREKSVLPHLQFSVTIFLLRNLARTTLSGWTLRRLLYRITSDGVNSLSKVFIKKKGVFCC